MPTRCAVRLTIIALSSVLLIPVCLAQQPTWERLPGFDGGWLVSVAVHPETGTILTTEDDAVFRSTDGGAGWSYAKMYLQFPSPIAIDSSGTVYVGSDAGVHASIDDGITWTRLAGIDEAIGALCVNRKTGTLLAGGTWTDVVYRSTDRGESWLPALHTGFENDMIKDLYCDATGTLYACTELSGIWNSLDDGITWAPLADSALAKHPVRCIAGDAGGNALYMGTDSAVCRSSDQGLSWSRTGFPEYATVYALYIHDDVHLFAGSDRGAFVSADEGVTWEDLQIPTSKLPVNRVNRFAYDILGGRLLAATSTGLCSMDMTTRSWKLIGVPALPITCIKPSENGRLYVAGMNYPLCVSVDEGLSWNPTDFNWVLCMAEDNVRDIVYAGGLSGIYKSTSGGKYWDAVNTSLRGPRSMLVLPDGTVLAGASTLMGQGVGVYASTDRGGTWERRNEGLSDTAVASMVRNWRSGMLMLSTMRGNIFRLSDDGRSWTPASTAWIHGTDVYLGLDSASGILAGTSNGYTFRTTDDGATWMSIGLNVGSSVNGFAVNAEGHIYAATGSQGVFRSTDLGQSWEQVVFGLPDLTVWSIAADKAGYVYAGLYHGGLYRTRFPTTRIEATPPPEVVSLEQNHPNPFSRSTAIRFSLEKSAQVRIVIEDALGRECAVLKDGFAAAGMHMCEWNPSTAAGVRLPSGVYTCRMRATLVSGVTHERTVRMVVNK